MLHRDPAHVFGDGIHSIKELIEKENYKRGRFKTNVSPYIVTDYADFTDKTCVYIHK